MAKGFGGIPTNMQGLVKQAQKMQEQLQRVHAEAAQITSDGSSGGGAVKVVVSGDNQIVSIALDKEIIDPNDAETLQEALVIAINGALSEVQGKVKAKFAEVTGGANIPGLF